MEAGHGPPAGKLVELSRAECGRLLARQEVGRVAFTERALPTVMPVNYVMDGPAVVFRTRADSRLARLLPGTVVAFEVDDLDRAARTGSSVVVTGIVERVAEAGALARLDALHLAPWAGDTRPVFLRIPPGLVTGRRILPPEAQIDRGC
jgi:nitroimidazol reductase NimA-like FMN-containing flavoprotein (pyridoxamine 5'-phosphate oxidase superfamily)